MKNTLSFYQHHPLTVALACSVCGLVFTVLVLFELRRRHVRAKKYEHACCYCSSVNVVRRHVRVKLSPEPSGNWLSKLFSRMDYLCQTQTTCLNGECPHRSTQDWNGLKTGQNIPVPEKTEIKTWAFRSQVFRFRQLRTTVAADQLIKDSRTLWILRERGLAEPTQIVVPEKKIRITNVEFPDVDLKGFHFNRLK